MGTTTSTPVYDAVNDVSCLSFSVRVVHVIGNNCTVHHLRLFTIQVSVTMTQGWPSLVCNIFVFLGESSPVPVKEVWQTIYEL